MTLALNSFIFTPKHPLLWVRFLLHIPISLPTSLIFVSENFFVPTGNIMDPKLLKMSFICCAVEARK